MPDTMTEYYDLVKPEVEGSAETWGEKLNGDLDKIDFAIRNCVHVRSHPDFNTPLTANVCEIPIYAPAQDSNSVQHPNLLTTQGWVEGRILFYLNRFIPKGTIAMWWGVFGSPNFPVGWTFCNGGLGSPNLQDRFVLCAGPLLAPQSWVGEPTAYPGEHEHEISVQIYPGPEAGAPLQVKDGRAVFPGNRYALPYMAVIYIYKYENW